MNEKTGTRLGGLLLGSTDPARLNAWYRAAFAPSAEPGRALDLNGTRLVFDQRDDLEKESKEPGRIIINLYVDDIETVAAHLESLDDVEWIRRVQSAPPGLLATIKDPDGNYVQILERRQH
jgi:predicted enzyme related to lactoylglutathione lyase